MLSDNKDINLGFWIEFYDLFEHKERKYKDLSLGQNKRYWYPSINDNFWYIDDEQANGLDEKVISKTKEYLKTILMW